MIHFEEYVHQLEALALAALNGNESKLQNIDMSSLLNGGTGAELRRRVSLAERQSIGAFFTGVSLRRTVFTSAFRKKVKGPIWDPACGAGDLLLSYAEILPLHSDINKTVSQWGEILYGSDIKLLFLRAAKARLVLAAYARGARRGTVEPCTVSGIFTNLVCKDSLTTEPDFSPAEIILNPPFIPIIADASCEWGNGRVSAAAVFIERCLKYAKKGARIRAILPDVLRTGSRYGRWRALVQQYSNVVKAEVYGTFDPQADVDVFVLELKAYGGRKDDVQTTQPWGIECKSMDGTIQSYCKVSVGSVVPHRDEEVGNEYAFLHSKCAPPWGSVDVLMERRRFDGTVFLPPFVAIRRTSSPSDKQRAIGTLVNCKEAVAVENHLIVCSPLDGRLSSCRKILKVLRSKNTTEWLNRRIRCRHLTVGSIKEIPWTME